MLKSLFKDSLTYGLSDVLIKILTFFTFPIVVSLMSVDEYGSLSLIMTLVSIVGLIMNIGLYNSVQRFFFDNKKGEEYVTRLISTAFYTLVLSCILVTGLFSIAAILNGQFFSKMFGISVKGVIIAVSVNITIQIIGFSKNILRLYFKPVKFIILSVFASFSSIIFSIVLLKMGFGIEGYFFGQLIMGLLTIPFSVLLFRKNLLLCFDIDIFKEIVKFGAPFITAGLGYWLFTTVDKWILRHYWGLNSVGIYSVGMKFSTLLYFVQSAFSQAWSPLALKYYNDQPLLYKKVFSDVFNIFYSLMVVLGAGLVFLTPDFIHFFLPGAYKESIIVSLLLVGAVVVNSTTQITLIGISLAKKTYLMNYAVWISVTLNTILNFILIPIYKENGAAMASLITYFILSLLYLVYSQKVHYIPYEYKKLISITILLIGVLVAGNYFSSINYNINHLIYKFLLMLVLIGVLLITKVINIKRITTHLRR